MSSSTYDAMIQSAAATYNMPFALIKGIISAESAFNPKAYRFEPSVNDASYGLMQLLSQTARELGFSGNVSGLYDPNTNIQLGTKFFHDLAQDAVNNGWGIDSAISSYNAGESGDRPGDGKRDTDRADGYTADGAQLAPFINQNYVDTVMAAASLYGNGPTPTLQTVAVTANAPSNVGLVVAAGVLLLLVVTSNR